MTGLNMKEILATGKLQDLNSITLDHQKQMMRDYCVQHPLVDYMVAVVDLYKKLSPGSDRKTDK
jgi:hypothetical protein